MKQIFIYTILVATGIFSLQCTMNEVDINSNHVARIIKTLSSDEMKGRHAFSPEIETAANFISNEFKQIGLKELDDSESYRQSFTIYSIKPDSSYLSINNRQVDEQSYFGVLNSQRVDWPSADSTHVFSIASTENFRSKFRDFLTDDVSSVVLVDEVHKDLFARFRMYFGRPAKTFELGSANDDIFVLHSGNASSIEIYFDNKVRELELSNIAGKIEGKRDDEIVLFTAHYDHIGVTPSIEGDSIANGANDNASGVAGVIELARHFSQLPTPERTIYFVTFTAEESGGYGSKYFSKQMNPDHIVTMFNIEMIGKPAVDGPNSAWITGFDRSTFGKILQESVKDSSFVFYPDPYPNQNLFYRSDNATLARLGVPAHSISTTPIDVDSDYHRVSDEFRSINISHTTNTITAIAKAAEGIINGTHTPTRLDPQTVD